MVVNPDQSYKTKSGESSVTGLQLQSSQQLPILAIDHDNVLCKYTEAFLNWHNVHYPILNLNKLSNLTLDDAKHYRMSLVLGCTDEEAASRIDEFAKTDDYGLIPPVEDAEELEAHLLQLATKYRLVIVTARKAECEKATKEWITRFLPNVPFVSIIFSAGRKKSEVCRQLQFVDTIVSTTSLASDISSTSSTSTSSSLVSDTLPSISPVQVVALIDDDPGNCRDCANSGVLSSMCILFNHNLAYPWAPASAATTTTSENENESTATLVAPIRFSKSWAEVVEHLMQ